MKQSILAVIHESATGLHQAGVLDTVTMQTFNALCLPGQDNAAVMTSDTRPNASDEYVSNDMAKNHFPTK